MLRQLTIVINNLRITLVIMTNLIITRGSTYVSTKAQITCQHISKA